MDIHGSKNTPPPAMKVANLGPIDLATNELRTIPLVCGEVSIPLLWIGQVYDQFTVDAPASRPGKK